MTYQAPVKDMLFVMNELAGLDNVAKLPGFEDATADTARLRFIKSIALPGLRFGKLPPASDCRILFMTPDGAKAPDNKVEPGWIGTGVIHARAAHQES